MSADLQPVIEKVRSAIGVEKSATEFVNGFQARLQAAVDAALANGATAEELVPVSDIVTELGAQSAALAEALAANPGPTPQATRRS